MTTEGKWGTAVGGRGGPGGVADPLVDPALWWREDLRVALRVRDIGTVYRLVLAETGMSQHRLANLVGQAQSEVSEILKGRRVKDIAVLERIVDRLGIPRELIGLSAYGPDGTYCGDDPPANPPQGDAEGDEDEMRRRLLLTSAGMAVVGRPIESLAELAGPAAAPLPDRIFEIHVTKVRNLGRALGSASRAYGSDPEVSSAAAAWAARLLGVPGAEEVKHALQVAVAELHLRAGFAGFDARLYDRAMYHYHRALELAAQTGDAYLQALTLSYAGLATEEHGHPDDGLKMLQFALVKAADIASDEQRAVVVGVGAREAVQACARADSATAYQRLGYPRDAERELARSRELWTPSSADASGDLDVVAARLALAQGRLDTAESFAAASVRRWDGCRNQRARVQAKVVLTTVHVRAGEPGGLALAHAVITDVARLSSIRTRTQLGPLATALAARPGPDAMELARTARQVVTTRV